MSFRALEKTNPYWSSFTCLAVAIIGKDFGKMAIGQAFKNLVEKDDYDKKDKDVIVSNLVKLTSLKNSTNSKFEPINTGVYKT